MAANSSSGGGGGASAPAVVTAPAAASGGAGGMVPNAAASLEELSPEERAELAELEAVPKPKTARERLELLRIERGGGGAGKAPKSPSFFSKLGSSLSAAATRVGFAVAYVVGLEYKGKEGDFKITWKDTPGIDQLQMITMHLNKLLRESNNSASVSAEYFGRSWRSYGYIEIKLRGAAQGIFKAQTMKLRVKEEGLSSGGNQNVLIIPRSLLELISFNIYAVANNLATLINESNKGIGANQYDILGEGPLAKSAGGAASAAPAAAAAGSGGGAAAAAAPQGGGYRRTNRKNRRSKNNRKNKTNRKSKNNRKNRQSRRN